MRARLHGRNGRLGFFREGTHEICDAAATGQLLPATAEWLARTPELRDPAVTSIELAENIPGDQRAVFVELRPGSDPARYAELTRQQTITDTLHVTGGGRTGALALTRSVRAFFQGNRYLLEPLVDSVAGSVGAGPAVDLYAGVGLFGLSLAAQGAESVTLVEGDRISSTDLAGNAQPFGDRVTIRRQSVESFLSHPPAAIRRTHPAFVVDPPRTGMTRRRRSGPASLRLRASCP
jgi:23S rRNA (uracil1939-C5)-methyltransferase